MSQIIPAEMTAIEITRPGAPEVLQPVKRPTPTPAPRQVLIKVHAAGVNGPDLFQRKGLYNPPPGVSDIPGLEISGEIVQVGSDVKQFTVGEAVIALVPGGGYAEYAVADERTTVPLPEGLSMIEGAALPETFMTVWVNLFQRGQFTAGESVLIHGGASGIGTTATMLAKALGASKIFTTVSNEEQQAASLALGADTAINYNEENFVTAVMDGTNGLGADVIVDIIAGDYVSRNFQAAAVDGRIVQIGVGKGPATQVDLVPMLTKRLTHIGSTLRSRSHDDKAGILAELKSRIWPQIRSGAVRPLIFKTFALSQAGQAHELMESARHIGKVVLTVAQEG